LVAVLRRTSTRRSSVARPLVASSVTITPGSPLPPDAAGTRVQPAFGGGEDQGLACRQHAVEDQGLVVGARDHRAQVLHAGDEAHLQHGIAAVTAPIHIVQNLGLGGAAT
jgi:hypothetical protein